jgi:exonuclease III
MSQRLIVWNVNHRSARHVIPQWLTEEIGLAAPDVLVLLEYVQGADHDKFLRDLSGFGLNSVSLSQEGYANQLLLATREEHRGGTIRGPVDIPWVPGNVLHVLLNDTRFHVVGFRMPAFEKEERRFKRPTWEWLREQAGRIVEAPAVIAGDFNTALGDSHAGCGDCIEALESDGWKYTIPASGHSWSNGRGQTKRRIDYAFLSPALVASTVEYSWAFRDNHDITTQAPGTPDHAMLQLDVTGLAA